MVLQTTINDIKKDLENLEGYSTLKLFQVLDHKNIKWIDFENIVEFMIENTGLSKQT